MSTTYFVPASDKQIAFIKKLQAERVVDDEQVNWALSLIEAGDMGKNLASKEIESLLSKPKKQAEKKPSEYVESVPGFYTDGEKFFEVVVSKQGHTYAKVLVSKGSKGTWSYAPGAMKNFQNWQPVTSEVAAEFGKKFGFCMICGRTLTNPESVSMGIGPICSGKVGVS